MKKNRWVRFFVEIIVFSLVSNTGSGQCFINKTSFPSGNVYTSKNVLLYKTKNKDFEVSTSLEKAFMSNDEYEFSIIFTVSGSIKYFFVPDVVEVTTLDGKKIYLYIPKHGELHEVGNYMYIECYGNFEKSDVNLISLMSNGIKEIYLKNNDKDLSIKINDSNLFINIFNCLKEKTK
jgi:hypothetical protein